MSSGRRGGGWTGVAVLVASGVIAGCDVFLPHDYSCPSGDCPIAPWDGGGPDAGGALDPGPDLGDPDAGTALRVITWNILWFGNTREGFGPSDETLQLENVRDVMAALSPDVFGLQEISDDTHLANLIAQLPGYAGFSARDARVADLSAYSDWQPRTGFLYRTAVVEVLSASIVTGLDAYDFAYRPPLRVDARVTKGGATLEVTFLILHLKASAGEDDWTRRRDSALQLKAWLDTSLPLANVLVIGDFNDDLDQSIATASGGGALPTPFAAFLDDPQDYAFATRVLTDAGLGTTVRYSSTIDHQLASDEMAARLEPGSVRRIRPSHWPTGVYAYPSTTSDHYPVEARYQLLAP